MYKYSSSSGKYVLYSYRREQFRNEIIAKNILCGITPYIHQDDFKFNYQINESDVTYENVISVLPSVDMVFDFLDADNGTKATYEL